MGFTGDESDHSAEGELIMPTSAEFWDLSDVRLKDAEGLLTSRRWA